MAKKKTDKETEPKKISKNRFTTFFKSETTHFVIGLISVIFSVYLLLAFISFFFTGAADQSILDNQQPGELMQTTNHVKNYAGARGAQLAEFLINECFGIAACFIILFLAVAGMKMIKAYQFRVWKWFMSCSILLVWFSITLGFIFDGTFSDSFIYPGGLHGYNVSAWLVSQIGMPGLGLLLLITALLFFVYLSSETINMIRKALHPKFRRKKKDTATATDNENNDTSIKPKREEKKEYSNPQPAVVDFELEQPMKVEVGSKEEEVSNTPFPFEEKQTSEPQRPMPTEANEEEEEDNDEPDFTVSDDTSEEDAEYKGPALQPYNPRLDLENYKFPTLDLLNQYEDNGPNIDMEEQNANKDRIIKVLRSFGIEIPGKGTIGIEVPNANPRIVPMQSILNSKKFQETTMELPIALGKTITNEVFMVDLAKAPHMLVAGATGQGKSVGLNAIVTSLLYKKHPAELKFVIVDPKKVEFSVYTPIERHFLAKLPDGEDAIITDVSKVVQTLNSLCIEMDTRYDLLRKAGCRNIKEYNAKFISRHHRYYQSQLPGPCRLPCGCHDGLPHHPRPFGCTTVDW